MSFDIHPDDSKIDPNVSCSKCEAVCCRLTVVLAESDKIPESLIAHGDNGLKTMAKGADGWCVALDRATMSCSIYADRPAVCRRFVMGAGYCRLEREKFASSSIPLLVA